MARTLPSLPITTNLALRLDASNFSSMYDATSGGNIVADGSTVARWEDQSGNGRHATQGTSNNRPVFKKYFGDIGGVYFDGSNDSLSGDLFSSAPSAETVFVISLQGTSSNGAFARLFTQYPSGGNDFSSTGHFIPLIGASRVDKLSAYASGGPRSEFFWAGNAIAVTSRHTGTVINTRINGTNSPTYSHTLGTGNIFAKYSVGGFDGQFFTTLIFEVLVYSSSLTNSELTQLEDYAEDKLRFYFL